VRGGWEQAPPKGGPFNEGPATPRCTGARGGQARRDAAQSEVSPRGTPPRQDTSGRVGGRTTVSSTSFASSAFVNDDDDTPSTARLSSPCDFTGVRCLVRFDDPDGAGAWKTGLPLLSALPQVVIGVGGGIRRRLGMVVGFGGAWGWWWDSAAPGVAGYDKPRDSGCGARFSAVVGYSVARSCS